MVKIGDIYWLTSTATILHPQVIISIQSDSVSVCSLTTNMAKANLPGNVVLEIGEGGLEKQSIVEVTKQSQVDKSELKTYIGTLSTERVQEILHGQQFVQKAFFDLKDITAL